MKPTFPAVLFALVLLPAAALRAVTPPAPQLLPASTVALLTVPDWPQATAYYRNSPLHQFWHDPAMKPLREKFERKLQEEVIAPMEKNLGVKLADYTELAQGQVTLALLRKQAAGITGDEPFDWLLIVDAGDRRDQLAKKLADARQRWVDAGRKLRTERLRGKEFTIVTLSAADFKLLAGKKDGAASPATPDPDDPPADNVAKERDLIIGQADSLLLAGSSTKEIEQVLARQGGSVTSSLAENAEYEAIGGVVRASRLHVWLNVKAMLDQFFKETEAKNTEDFVNPFAPDPRRVVGALGLGGLKSVVLALDELNDGGLVHLFLAAPESTRKGLLKILASPPRDAAPPAFVPADAVKFTRWRADGRQLWATLETMVGEIQPQLGGMLKMTLEMAGKDKDPNFDLRKVVIDNLGDDLITYQRPPRTAQLADLAAPPTLYLIGSPKPETLIQGLNVLTGMMGQPDGASERELLGRKVYSFKLAPSRGPGGVVTRTLHYTHGRGYLALTTDEALLEEFLRSAEGGGRSLRDTAGLAEAAARVGGMGTGWFGYENQSDTMRLLFQAARKDPSFADQFFNNPATALSGSALGGVSGTPPGGGLKEWFDFSLLPPFEQVARYFHYTINSGSAQREGISLRTFMPHPPNLPKTSGSGGR